MELVSPDEIHHRDDLGIRKPSDLRDVVMGKISLGDDDDPTVWIEVADTSRSTFA